MMTAASNAVPNPSMIKESPIMDCVSIKVIALITNKNKPNDRTVTGRVKIMRMGFTITFRIDRIMLAMTAEPTPSK